jgi:hypothetical protein
MDGHPARLQRAGQPASSGNVRRQDGVKAFGSGVRTQLDESLRVDREALSKARAPFVGKAGSAQQYSF